jgi:glyoxylate reductase
VAKRARAFGMKIQYHNRNRLTPERAAGATYVSFDQLVSQSDVISLNLSLTASTKHIIGAPEFEKMKPGVVIVNTARGALIDEAALVDALESGKVRDFSFVMHQS